MNQIKNIIESWKVVEQLSEGSIKSTSKALKVFDDVTDYYVYFKQFLDRENQKEKLDDTKAKDTGIVLYLNIFNFQEVVDIIKQKLDITDSDEEIISTEKFSFAIYFNYDLQHLDKYFFYSISGYVRNHKQLPENMIKEEDTIRKIISEYFEGDDFNNAFKNMVHRFGICLKNSRFQYLKNCKNANSNLHSFYLDDLNLADRSASSNLRRYLLGCEERTTLDTKNNSSKSIEKIAEILQPKHYPLGRFPSNPEFALSLMQQVAVNLILKDKNNIRSVNGPPGTGKTTLLKDIFADMLVEQARFICSMSKVDKSDESKLIPLPSEILDLGIIVASSNNAAVQNIVNELPKKSEIANDDFLEKLRITDYFQDIATELLSEDNNTIKCWGLISAEAGKMANRKKLKEVLESVIDNLEDSYRNNPEVYEKFRTHYLKMKSVRDEKQGIYELKIKNKELQSKYNQGLSEIKTNKTRSEEIYKQFCQNIDKIQNKISKLRDQQGLLDSKLSQIDVSIEIAENELDLIQTKKPTFFLLKRIIGDSSVKRYIEEITEVKEKILLVTKDKANILKMEHELEKGIELEKAKKSKIQGEYSKDKSENDILLYESIRKSDLIKGEIDSIESKIKSYNQEFPDFSSDYETLQKTNFWFDKNFRYMQNELFILALSVRKQYLYENRQNLREALKVWNNTTNYEKKEIVSAWHWINFVVPVISTTLASFSRMFSAFGDASLPNVFIDEAGQALPQACVGAVMRSKRIVMVGDPSQIEPVVTLDSAVFSLLKQKYTLDDNYLSSKASAQTLCDRASQYGYERQSGEWIGIPLWVHRRCKDPMFSISNAISYDGLMVQGKLAKDSNGKGNWIDVEGVANDKFVTEQVNVLIEEIRIKINEHAVLPKEIFVISPFKKVATMISSRLSKENLKDISVGTVHTFQGKEAKVVYLVLGADENSRGAAFWAVGTPNIMNVAATRAKEEFYIIGSQRLYSSLGSKVVKETLKQLNKSF